VLFPIETRSTVGGGGRGEWNGRVDGVVESEQVHRLTFSPKFPVDFRLIAVRLRILGRFVFARRRRRTTICQVTAAEYRQIVIVTPHFGRL